MRAKRDSPISRHGQSARRCACIGSLIVTPCGDATPERRDEGYVCSGEFLVGDEDDLSFRDDHSDGGRRKTTGSGGPDRVGSGRVGRPPEKRFPGPRLGLLARRPGPTAGPAATLRWCSPGRSAGSVRRIEAGDERRRPTKGRAPSAQADQLPSFTTTRRERAPRPSWRSLTTYLPRLMAVSGFRGLRGELRRGLTGFLFTWPLALRGSLSQ